MEVLLGFKAESIETLATAVSSSLGIKFHLHESLWHGGDYYRFEQGPESIILQRNNDGGPDEEPAEEEFPEWPFLLYLETERSATLLDRLKGCPPPPTLLRPEGF